MSNYSELLRNPRWQKKRLQILERDNWSCLICGDKDKTLHVHHKFYIKGRSPWEYPDYYLSTLCHECHEEETRINKEESGILHDVVSRCGLHSQGISSLAIALYELSKLSLSEDEMTDVFTAIERSCKNKDTLVGLLEYGSSCRGAYART